MLEQLKECHFVLDSKMQLHTCTLQNNFNTSALDAILSMLVELIDTGRTEHLDMPALTGKLLKQLQ